MPLDRSKRLLRHALCLGLLCAALGCTVPPEQERAPLAAQVPTLLDDRAIMDDGYELPLEHWLPEAEPQAVVLALHGFNDYRNAFVSVDRKSTRLNSSHVKISYAVFCFNKKTRLCIGQPPQ